MYIQTKKLIHLQTHCQSPASQRSNQSFVKEFAKPTQVAKGIFAITQKNKINLCFVDRFVQIENDLKIKAK